MENRRARKFGDSVERQQVRPAQHKQQRQQQQQRIENYRKITILLAPPPSQRYFTGVVAERVPGDNTIVNISFSRISLENLVIRVLPHSK